MDAAKELDARQLDAAELAALMHFYADAGVEWLLDDAPADRIAEFTEQKAAKARSRAPAAAREGEDAAASSPPARPAAGPATAARAAPTTSASPAVLAIPDSEAVAAARLAADSAGSLVELKAALESFGGCNLKNSARSTVSMSGDPASGIMVIGPMPNAEDDRDGLPFSGRAGQLLDRMLRAIGLERDRVLLTNIIPWRPPGNRMPSAAEREICRPFIERQLVLAQPRFLLLLGNFPARFFFGTGTIHQMRGQWMSARLGSGAAYPALATFHPQELLATPANKALVWQDLLAFKAQLGGD